MQIILCKRLAQGYLPWIIHALCFHKSLMMSLVSNVTCEQGEITTKVKRIVIHLYRRNYIWIKEYVCCE